METTPRSKNPFRVAENIVNIIGWTIVGTGAGLGAALLIWAAIDYYDLGWWGLLFIPGVPIGLIVLIVLSGLIHGVCYWIADRWRRAKSTWDREHEVGS